MLDQLRDNHRQLEASAARLSRLLAATTPDSAALEAARWDIGTRAMKHMALEDRHLLTALANDPRPEVAARARQYQTEFAQYIADYAEHAKYWTADRVVAEWDRYRAMTRTQLSLMAERIRRVEQELFPLARSMSLDVAHAPSTSWTKHAFAIKDSISSGGKAGMSSQR